MWEKAHMTGHHFLRDSPRGELRSWDISSPHSKKKIRTSEDTGYLCCIVFYESQLYCIYNDGTRTPLHLKISIHCLSNFVIAIDLHIMRVTHFNKNILPSVRKVFKKFFTFIIRDIDSFSFKCSFSIFNFFVVINHFQITLNVILIDIYSFRLQSITVK